MIKFTIMLLATICILNMSMVVLQDHDKVAMWNRNLEGLNK